VKKKRSRREEQSSAQRSFLGTAGSSPSAASRAGADLPRIDSWPVPPLSTVRGFRTKLNDEQRDLATRYLPLAESVATIYRDRHLVDRDEIRSAAYMALVEAARTYDPSRRVNFATFARHRIRGALRDYLRFALASRGRGKNLLSPQFEKLHLGLEEEGRVRGIAPQKPVDARIESLDDVESWLRRLPKTHALACRMIYMSGKSQDEVAALLGFSRSYLCRLHNEALRLLIEDYNRSVDGQPQAASERAERPRHDSSNPASRIQESKF
jgi:RNA polymerase sigma factor (sigma-70 family)